MDFASLTRQVRIYKGIDAFLSMLIGLLRTNLLNDSEWTKDLGNTRRDEFRQFTLLPLRSSPSLPLSRSLTPLCLFTTRSRELHEFKRVISVQFLAKKEFHDLGHFFINKLINFLRWNFWNFGNLDSISRSRFFWEFIIVNFLHLRGLKGVDEG